MHTTPLLKFLLRGLATAFTAAAASIAAASPVELTVRPESGKLLLGTDQELVVDIGLRCAEPDRPLGRPLNIAVVLDRSGSMSGAKLEQARQAAILLVRRLRPGDTFSLVAFDDDVRVVVPAQPVEDVEAIADAIRRIDSGGSTALYAGVESGVTQLRRYLEQNHLHRVLLLSDGIANVGPSQPSDLSRLGRELRREGIAVTTIGLGDDYHEDTMVALAEASAANYYYVRDTEKLPSIFAEELGRIQAIVARRVRIRLEAPDSVEILGIVGYPEARRSGRSVELEVGELYGRQEMHLLARVRVPAIEKRPPADLLKARIDFHDERADRPASLAGRASVGWTEKPEVATASAVSEVQVRRALAETLVARDEALAVADKGDADGAAAILLEQARRNAELPAAAAAPAVAQESAALKDIASSLAARGVLSKSERKEVQAGNYDRRRQVDIPYVAPEPEPKP